MKTVFADTYYFLALLNARDVDHARAAAFASKNRVCLVTTTWVMTELADALCASHRRATFSEFYVRFCSNPNYILTPATQ